MHLYTDKMCVEGGPRVTLRVLQQERQTEPQCLCCGDVYSANRKVSGADGCVAHSVTHQSATSTMYLHMFKVKVVSQIETSRW